MKFLARSLLLLNGILLLFIVLWLLVGGGNRGYFGGGSAAEVDGILLMILALFNVIYLAAVYVTINPRVRHVAEQQAIDELGQGPFPDGSLIRNVLRAWSQWALLINGMLILFTGLWLIVSTDRWHYFRGNATQVDMILLFGLSILNIAFMGLTWLRFSLPRQKS